MSSNISICVFVFKCVRLFLCIFCFYFCLFLFVFEEIMNGEKTSQWAVAPKMAKCHSGAFVILIFSSLYFSLLLISSSLYFSVFLIFAILIFISLYFSSSHFCTSVYLYFSYIVICVLICTLIFDYFFLYYSLPHFSHLCISVYHTFPFCHSGNLSKTSWGVFSVKGGGGPLTDKIC